MITTNKIRFAALPLAAITAFGVVSPVLAQGSFLHRHHKAAGMVGGYAAYKAAKVSGNRRRMAGQHRNFAQRHPILSGVAAGAVTNHYAKKHQ